MAESVAAAVLDSEDPETVRQGMPTFLLMMEGRLRDDPDDPDAMLAAGALYSAYAGVLEGEPERQARLADRAFSLLSRAAGTVRPELGDLRGIDQDTFRGVLARLEPEEAELLFTLAQAWMTRIRANPDDLDAMADLPRVRALLERLLELDPEGQGGAVHMFLGVIASIREAAMGGDPEPARRLFERALQISERKSLMFHVAYARAFAAATGDEELYRRLLEEVLAAEPRQPGRTLMNAIAQEEARTLLAEAEGYEGAPRHGW